MILTWTKSFSGSEYRIFRGKLIVGLFKSSFWTGNAYGELNGYMVTFKPKGFLKSGTLIFDIEGKTQLGSITYSLWKQRAEINYENEIYSFRYTSWMHHSWEVKTGNNLAVFKSTRFWGNKGEMDVEDIPGAVLLSAFYINARFARLNKSS